MLLWKTKKIHTTQPEVGGLILRNPLELELFRNYKHSMNGLKLKKQLESLISIEEDNSLSSSNTIKNNKKSKNKVKHYDLIEPSKWYYHAQVLIQNQMKGIASRTNRDGHVDGTTLSDEYIEFLQLFIDQQEHWQEVSLIIYQDDNTKYTETIQLNRPMALKLTPNLAQLILYGTKSGGSTSSTASTSSSSTSSSWMTSSLSSSQKRLYRGERDDDDYYYHHPDITNSDVERQQKKLMSDFLLAFGNQCGIYIGGTDHQNKKGIMIHGIPNLPGSYEISSGTNIYIGGIEGNFILFIMPRILYIYIYLK